MVNEFSSFLSVNLLRKILPERFFFSKTPLSENARQAIID